MTKPPKRQFLIALYKILYIFQASLVYKGALFCVLQGVISHRNEAYIANFGKQTNVGMSKILDIDELYRSFPVEGTHRVLVGAAEVFAKLVFEIVKREERV